MCGLDDSQPAAPAATKRALYVEYTRRLRLLLTASGLRADKGREWSRLEDLVLDLARNTVESEPFRKLLDHGVINLLSDIMGNTQVNPVFYATTRPPHRDKHVRLPPNPFTIFETKSRVRETFGHVLRI